MSDKSPTEIREAMWKAMAASPYVMLGLTGKHQHSEPMYAVLDEDADSEFWFYTKRDNRAAEGGPAMVQFIAKGHDLFACIAGTLTEESDPTIIDKYWSMTAGSLSSVNLPAMQANRSWPLAMNCTIAGPPSAARLSRLV